jgi:HK97 family phage portal protein
MNLLDRIALYIEKNRAQPEIQQQEGNESQSRTPVTLYQHFYRSIPTANRAVNLIVDSASKIGIDVQGRLGQAPRTQASNGEPFYVRKKTLEQILNFSPNPFENIDEFHRQLYMDLVVEGNCYQYFDGKYLWHLPANEVTILTGKKSKIEGYRYGNDTTFSINEVIHTRENAVANIYRGQSKLEAARNSMRIVEKMTKFQENFFDNGAIPGLVLVTEHVLGSRIKERILNEIKSRYSALKNGRNPLILDANLKPHQISNNSFKELDFTDSKENYKQEILEALGVPSILLNSGNNANINPNIRLFYETTILPLADKLIASYEIFFGYDLEPDVYKIRALRPDLREAGAFFSAMVNNGIVTINEARRELRLEKSTEEHADKLRIPQNITGSATDSSQGGRPPKDEEDDA